MENELNVTTNTLDIDIGWQRAVILAISIFKGTVMPIKVPMNGIVIKHRSVNRKVERIST